MMYDFWDMKCDRQNILSFWTTFCPFTPLTTWKVKILKNWKKHLEILSFYMCVPQIMIRWCTVPEIRWMTDVIVISHFGLFFALSFHFPISPKNQNLKKKLKNAWRYHHFTIMYQKSWSYAILFLRYGAWQM